MDVQMLAVDGRNLRVGTSRGAAGSRPLLLFNGIGANLDLVRGFAGELEHNGIGIAIFDVPGTGGSSPAERPYRLASLAELANKVLDALGISGPVDVAGVSWGGGLAQEFTHRFPRRVRRLVLAATTAGSLALPGRPSVLAKLLSPRRYTDRAYMTKIGGALYGGKLRADPRLLQEYGALLRPPKGTGYYYQLLAGAGWTSAHWLHNVRQPTLVMVGSDDPIVPPGNGRILALLIPNARLVTISDGHLFLVTSAQESARIISDFLKDEKAAGNRAVGAVG